MKNFNITHIPEYLSSKERFNSINEIKPTEYSKIVLRGDNKRVTHRYHRSYLNTPIYDSDTFNKIDKNYMFSGLDGKEIEENLPEILQPYLDYINAYEDIKFNQVTVNWFDSGDNFIPLHTDCEYNMIKGSEIKIISLGSSRYFSISPIGDSVVYNYTVENGSLLTMDNQFQKKYKHGILPHPHTNSGPRISISFRKYIDKNHTV